MPLLFNAQHDDHSRRTPNDELYALLLTGAGFAVTLIFGLVSDGIHHLDDVTHFLFAKWAWTWPEYLLHNWGRPGFTALYWIPAYFGWHAARAWSAVLSALTVWFAFRIAQHVGVRRAWLVPAFVYLQPRFFTLALTTLTETAMGFYATGAILLALRRQWGAAAAVLSLALTARHEAIVLVPLFLAAAVAWGDSPLRLWPVFWAPVVVNLLAAAFGLNTTLALFLHPSGSGNYGYGGIYEYFCRSIEAFGPAIAALGFVGAWLMWRYRGGPFVVACGLTVFATHVLIRLLGKFDSGGYSRFLVPISPLWAIMALVTWNHLTQRDARRRARIAVAVAATLAGLMLATELQIMRFGANAMQVEHLWEAQWAIRGCALVLAIVAAGVWRDANAAGGGGAMFPMRRGAEQFALSLLAIVLIGMCLSTLLQLWAANHAPRLLMVSDKGLAGLRSGKQIIIIACVLTGLVAVIAYIAATGRSERGLPSLVPTRVALIGMMILASVALCGVLRPGPMERIAERELQWLRDNGYGDRPMVSAHVWMHYLWGVKLSPRHPGFARQIDAAPAGTIIIHDSHLAPYNETPPVAADDLYVRDKYFKALHRSEPFPYAEPAFRVFEKIADGGDLTASLEASPRHRR